MHYNVDSVHVFFLQRFTQMLYRNSVVIFILTSLVVSFILFGCSGGSSPLFPPGNESMSLTATEQNAVLAPGIPADLKGGPINQFRPANIPEYAPDEVLVVLRDGVVTLNEKGRPLPSTSVDAVRLLVDNGLVVKRVIPLSWGTVYRLGIHDGTSVPDKVAQLKSLSEISIAEPNYIVQFCETPYFPNDPLWENPNDDDDDPRTTVFEQYGPAKIGASVVWNENKGNSDVVVCVLDTGVNWWHEDLQANMWTNPGEIPDNGIDDDGNGYIDDYWGWDTASNDNDITEYNPGGSYHGTACSGVVGAVQDNFVGCSGIAPGIKIMGIKCDLSGGGGYTSSVIEGVQYATDNGAHIISMSFRTYSDSETMHATMDAAWAQGVILCGGAGNEDSSQLTYPACWDSVVEVGGTTVFSPAPNYSPINEVRITVAGGYGWGSNYGVNLEVMAYGVFYITTYGSDPDAYWDGTDNFFFGGTSNATPMVAASFGLLKSFFPEADSVWLRERMRETADDLYQHGFDTNSGHGRVNLIRACYGPDRYSDYEDADGFVDIEE
ncbi:MAG TPA: hypothetical protein ENN67_03335, partial [Firmicutes bacterium]|nr:hypothetical protein [Bacillota bacterium]